jgi:hypothetical protein
MGHSHNEFDGLAPNTQKPPTKGHPATIGFPWNRWDEVHSASGSFDCITISGALVEPYNDTIVQAPLVGNFSSYIIVHSLGTEFVDVQLYDTTKEVVQPDSIVVIDKNSMRINFVEPQEGVALIQKGKIV